MSSVVKGKLMLTFKEYAKLNEESVFDTIKSAIKKKSLARTYPHIDEWIGNHKEDNQNLAKADEDTEPRRAASVFQNLHKSVKATPEESEAVDNYISHDEEHNSLPLNRALKKGTKLAPHLEKMRKNLSSLISKNPAQHEYHAYSGLSYDPEKMKDENGQVTLNHFSSLTTSRSQGHSYSHDLWKKPEEQPIAHVARIKINKGAAVTPADKAEQEIIMGPGKLKHNDYKDYHQDDGKIVRVHEMETV